MSAILRKRFRSREGRGNYPNTENISVTSTTSKARVIRRGIKRDFGLVTNTGVSGQGLSEAVQVLCRG